MLELRVATFNMLSHGYTKFNTKLHGNTANGPKSLETDEQNRARNAKNKALFAKMRPDVLLLQEHDAAVSLCGHFTTISAFVQDRKEGCSVAVRTGVRPWDDVFFTSGFTIDLDEGKTCAVAVLDIFLSSSPDVIIKPVAFASLHLKGGEGAEATRVKQIAKVVAFLEPYETVVLGGDFNDTDPEASGTSAPLLAAGFTKASYDGPSGFNSGMDTPLQLDYIYVRGSGVAVSIIAPVVAPAVPWLPDAISGSDHVPVPAHISFFCAPTATPVGAGTGAGDGGDGVAQSASALSAPSAPSTSASALSAPSEPDTATVKVPSDM